jgi:peptidoglycan hydrolase-like protein with peptidoglycan-binding domain
MSARRDTLLPAIALAAALLAVAPASAASCGPDGMPADIYRAYVRGVQEELPRHGYRPGPATGSLDARTRAAIRQYQRDAGLPGDGCASKALLDHLQFHLPKVYAHGATPQGGIVVAVQQELIRRGYFRGPADGKLGPRTRSAIKQFQWDAKLRQTGIADQALLDRLRTADPSVHAR